MMLYPAIDLLKTKVDSRYTLAVMTAKRARDLIDGKPQLTITENDKPISVATAEVAGDLISYKRAAVEEEE
ncbi:MAG: DNA-directed RNA polymerase subunit omega [Clostridia bacterium]|nr:DNA-directed RNA polymerase subunit omega [Clostridia bacterium]